MEFALPGRGEIHYIILVGPSSVLSLFGKLPSKSRVGRRGRGEVGRGDGVDGAG